MSELRFFVDLNCQDALHLHKCTKLYPDFDWYLGFQCTVDNPSKFPEILPTGQRIQLFKMACPLLPRIGKHIGLYCSHSSYPFQYCVQFLSKNSNEIPVFIIHKIPRITNTHPPRIMILK